MRELLDTSIWQDQNQSATRHDSVILLHAALSVRHGTRYQSRSKVCGRRPAKFKPAPGAAARYSMPADWLQKFIKQGLISAEQLAEADDMAANMGISTGDALVRLGYVSGAAVAQAQAAAYGYEFISLDGRE